jgi:hypothetical protein
LDIYWNIFTTHGHINVKITYIILQEDSVFVEIEGRKGKKENLSGEPFIKNLATSTGPEIIDQVQNFSHVCYDTLQSESFATGTENNSLLLLAYSRTYIMMAL